MEIIREELKLAHEMLTDARLLLSEGRHRSAANRVYYAFFHSARALLTHLGVECKSHAGTISKFGEHITKEGLIEKRYGKYLNQAFNLREKSDYQIIATIDKAEIEGLVNQAEDFINEIERIIKEIDYKKKKRTGN